MLLIDETVAEGIISSDCKGPKSFAAHSCKFHLSFELVLNGENYFVAMASLVSNFPSNRHSVADGWRKHDVGRSFEGHLLPRQSFRFDGLPEFASLFLSLLCRTALQRENNFLSRVRRGQQPPIVYHNFKRRNVTGRDDFTPKLVGRLVY